MTALLILILVATPLLCVATGVATYIVVFPTVLAYHGLVATARWGCQKLFR